ncbi:MAG: hypothetical protein V4692_01480, partial [Bdellovibrionota bacterium]
MKFNDDSKKREIVIQLLKRVSPDFSVTGEAKIQKNVLLSPLSYAIVLSPKGDLIYYRAFSAPVQDFRPHIVDGKIFYSILQVTNSNVDVNSEGMRLILDENFKVIAEHQKITDGHEFHYLKPKHYVYLTYDVRDTPSGKCYLDQSVVEEIGGKETYRFSVYDYVKRGYLPDSSYNQSFKGRSCVGHFHLNTVQILGPNHWLLGFSGGLVILWNKSKKTAEWIFNGPEDQFFAEGSQRPNVMHTPIWDPESSRLTLFDNDHLTKNARVIEYRLNIPEKKMLSFREWRLNNGISRFGGGIQVEGDSIFSVGFGAGATGTWDFAEIENGK